MELKEETIRVNEKDYKVIISKKAMRSLSMRLSKDGESILVHAPYFVNKKAIMAFVREKAPILIKKAERRKIDIPEGKSIVFGETIDKEISEKEKKETLLAYCLSSQKEYEKIMGVPPYNVKIRTMTSRWGVNNKKTNTITYSTNLISYSKEIIDAIIVHELSHHFERNHQKGFYAIVFRYCPNYKTLIKKLKKGEIK